MKRDAPLAAKKSRRLTKTQIRKLVGEALEILQSFGVPTDNLTERKKERMAKAFLAVAGLGPFSEWSDVRSIDEGHRLLSRQILRVMNEYFGETIADSSYDDIRRKDLLFPVEAGIVLRSAGKENASTNDGTRSYALDPSFAKQIRLFGTSLWNDSLALFMENRPTLVDSLKRTRDVLRVPVLIDSAEIVFSPGEHNHL